MEFIFLPTSFVNTVIYRTVRMVNKIHLSRVKYQR